MGNTRDAWRKAIRIVCMTKHQKTCKRIDNCNGNYCNNCHKSGEEYELVIDEIDNNRFNHDPENQQLLCKSCNQKKSPKHLKPKRNTGSVGVRENFGADGLVDESVRQRAIANNPQMEISQELKVTYLSLLRQKVKRPQGCLKKEAIFGLAKIMDISPVTTRRMLGVETESEEGRYMPKKRAIKQDDGSLKAFTFIEFRPEALEEEKVLDSIPSSPSKVIQQPEEAQEQKPVIQVATSVMDITNVLKENAALKDMLAKMTGIGQPGRKLPGIE